MAFLSVGMIFCKPHEGSGIASAAIHHLGRISYSVYLFQQFVFAPQKPLYGAFSWWRFAILLPLAAVVVEVWFRVCEDPIRLWGAQRFARPQKAPRHVEAPVLVGR
jgi:peptidoglycan/LPS O-acetylase OafA/YrhL